MKFKTIVLGWLAMCMCQIAISQVSFGVQGGASFFKLTSIEYEEEPLFIDIDISRPFTPGYYVALVADIPLKKNFSIHGELSMIRKGDAFVVKGKSISNSRHELRFQYIELPIMAKYHFDFGKKTGLELGLGFSGGYLFKIDEWRKQNGEILSEEIPISNEYNSGGVKLNRWDISPIVDVAIPLRAKFGDFKIGMRGSFDLTHWQSYEANASFPGTEGVYNWGMMLYGGYTISKVHFNKKQTSSDVM